MTVIENPLEMAPSCCDDDLRSIRHETLALFNRHHSWNAQVVINNDLDDENTMYQRGSLMIVKQAMWTFFGYHTYPASSKKVCDSNLYYYVVI